MKKYLLEIIIFVSGAVVMALELSGSRVLAPYLGSSLFVWSSLIGLILGALSLGYWFGGRMADKNPNWPRFSAILLLSAILIGLTAYSKDFILSLISNQINDIRLSSTLATLILFAPASFTLGMVSPYAVRLKIENLNTSGKTVGNLYAISTLGSIFGTLSAGFFLISLIGTTNLIFILAMAQALCSFFAYAGNYNKIKIILIIALSFGLAVSEAISVELKNNGLIDKDTAYSRIIIYEGIDANTGKTTRYLRTDNFSVQSAMFLENDELVFQYNKFFRLAEYFKPDPKEALMIGGAAYTYPRDFLKQYPEAKIDVVEIDPQMTKLARQYFNLYDHPRLNNINQDGRIFLNKNNKLYDMIFIDAFNSYNPPFQLTTIEAVKRIYRSLADDGIVMTNIISAIEGRKGKLLRAELKTYQQVFPEVRIFTVKSNDPYKTQNIILTATKHAVDLKSDNPDGKILLNHLWDKKITDDMPVIVDDFAPVEKYTLDLQI